MALKYANWLCHLSRLRGPDTSQRGAPSEGAKNGRIGYMSTAVWGSPPLQRREQNLHGPTNGRIGYGHPFA